MADRATSNDFDCVNQRFILRSNSNVNGITRQVKDLAGPDRLRSLVRGVKVIGSSD